MVGMGGGGCCPLNPSNSDRLSKQNLHQNKNFVVHIFVDKIMPYSRPSQSKGYTLKSGRGAAN